MDCYGNYSYARKDCRVCDCRVSCRYYRCSGKKVDAREHIVSFDHADYLDECMDFINIPGLEPAEPNHRSEMISALSRFFRYLLELDEYTIGIISEVVKASRRGVHCTVPYLSRVHGCSRQAMHRKLMKIIGAHPELAGLFRDTLYKLSSSRQSFLRRRAGAAVGK